MTSNRLWPHLNTANTHTLTHRQPEILFVSNWIFFLSLESREESRVAAATRPWDVGGENRSAVSTLRPPRCTNRWRGPQHARAPTSTCSRIIDGCVTDASPCGCGSWRHRDVLWLCLFRIVTSISASDIGHRAKTEGATMRFQGQ